MAPRIGQAAESSLRTPREMGGFIQQREDVAGATRFSQLFKRGDR